MLRRPANRLLLPLVSAMFAVGVAAQRSPSPEALAVIVHPDNATTDLTLAQLRSYFLLDRKSWPNRQRAVLYLRPSRSREMKILLDLVYRKTAAALRKHWRGQVFQGKITVKPSVVPSAAAAVERVRSRVGAFTVVLAKDVPKEGVRTLRIGGKLPGEPGYPLTTAEQ